MPAYFESGFFTDNEPFWHGMGDVFPEERLTTAKVMATQPILASPVEARPLFTYGNDGVTLIPVGDWKVANVRVYDEKIVGVVGERFKVIHPDTKFDFMDSLIDSGEAIWKTGGTLYDGRVMWLLAELPQAIKLAGMDSQVANRYILLYDSFDGSSNLEVMNTRVLVGCANTVALARTGAPIKFKVRHTGSLDSKLQAARNVLGMQFEYDEALDKVADELVHTSFTDAEFHEFLESLVPSKDEHGQDKTGHSYTRAVNIKNDVAGIYFGHNGDRYNQDPIRNTAWGALQSVIAYDNHEATTRTTKYASKEENRFYRIVNRPEANIVTKAEKILLPA